MYLNVRLSRVVCLSCVTLCVSSCILSGSAAAQDVFASARQTLVRRHIAAEGITNKRVLESMRVTPRHEFMAPNQRHLAYVDMAVPIGHGQTISPPYVVAFMTAQLDPRTDDRVLEIGTGSGYQAAVLSPLVADVYTIEIVRALGQTAAGTLRRLKYDNVHTRIGDGFEGWAEHAPFDKIIVTCSPENIPNPLIEQLADGGTMIIPVGARFQQTLFRFVKDGESLRRESLQGTFFVPMTGEAEDRRKALPDVSRPALVHGSFEETLDSSDAPAGWYYVREGIVSPDPQAPDGDKVVVFSNSIAGRSAHALQAFGVDGREVSEIDVSAWVSCRGARFGPQPHNRARVLIEFYADDRSPVGQATLGPWAGTFPWRAQKKRVRVPSKARLAVIGLGLFGAIGEISVDDVQVQAVPSS